MSETLKTVPVLFIGGVHDGRSQRLDPRMDIIQMDAENLVLLEADGGVPAKAENVYRLHRIVAPAENDKTHVFFIAAPTEFTLSDALMSMMMHYNGKDADSDKTLTH